MSRVIEHDFIAADCCEALIQVHERFAVPNDEFMPGFRTARLAELGKAGAPPETRELVDFVRLRMRQRLRAALPHARPMFIQYSGLESVSDGCAFPAHADNCQFDLARDAWTTSMDSCRLRSAVLYLNDSGCDFDGGMFEFVDRAEYERSSGRTVRRDGDPLVPRAGTLVMFTSGPENVHRVTPITRGRRYTLAMWLAEDPGVCEIQVISDL
jgi:predicted 2-oxoglutarate/Fe(II)-dependent dioxygenase YbiX